MRRKDWPETRRLTADGNDYSISFIEDPDGYEVVERGTIKVGGMI